MNKNELVYDKAQEGLKLIYESILEILEINPEGLGNSQIAEVLGLESSHNGNSKNFLTYSVLGNLMKQDKVSKSGSKLYKITK